MSSLKVLVSESKTITPVDIMKFEKEKGSGISCVADYSFVQSRMNLLLGQVLTLVDASITNSQNKAMKDIIKGIFVEEYCQLTEMMHDEAWLKKVTTFDDDNKPELVEVDTDEALGLK